MSTNPVTSLPTIIISLENPTPISPATGTTDDPAESPKLTMAAGRAAFLRSDTIVAAIASGQVESSAGSLTEIATRRAKTGVVIVASRSREELSELSDLENVIPVYLSPDARSKGLADAGVVQVSNICKIDYLFEIASNGAILELCNLEFSSVRAAQGSRLSVMRSRIQASGGIHIYGAGNIGRQACDAATAAGLNVISFLDRDPAQSGKLLSGVPIRLPPSLVAADTFVVVAIGNGVSAVTRDLTAAGVKNFIGLSELYALARSTSEPEAAYLDDLEVNRWRYLSLFFMLDDERSRRVLEAVVKHRLTLSAQPLIEICEQDHTQWFAPEILPRMARDVFVDGGAYDGDTVAGYIAARGHDFHAIHAFELDPDLVAAGRAKMAGVKNVKFHNIGLSDRAGEVLYRRTRGTDGAIGSLAVTSGDQHDRSAVAIGRIDDIVTEPITFLKLDVEGEEAKAIDGAARQISQYCPTLAVALYHKAHDLWDLPRQILTLQPRYKLRLRHYTHCAYETVVYAIPTNT